MPTGFWKIKIGVAKSAPVRFHVILDGSTPGKKQKESKSITATKPVTFGRFFALPAILSSDAYEIQNG